MRPAIETLNLATRLEEFAETDIATRGPDFRTAASTLRVLLAMVEDLAPPLPINTDDGGCVWCGGTPPGGVGYAKALPEHHDATCPWLVARMFVGLGESPSESPSESRGQACSGCADAHRHVTDEYDAEYPSPAPALTAFPASSPRGAVTRLFDKTPRPTGQWRK